jgi:hypothetical protein
MTRRQSGLLPWPTRFVRTDYEDEGHEKLPRMLTRIGLGPKGQGVPLGVFGWADGLPLGDTTSWRVTGDRLKGTAFICQLKSRNNARFRVIQASLSGLGRVERERHRLLELWHGDRLGQDLDGAHLLGPINDSEIRGR